MTATSPDRPPARLLPPGRHLAVTWGIPDEYGGMTAALLRRSRSFVRDGGAAVDIVTFDPGLDLPHTSAALLERGELIDGVRLRNIYDDFRTRPAPPSDIALDPALDTNRPPDATRGGDAGLREWTADGHTVRLEHARADGSVAVLDERRRASGPRRLITTFDTSGAPTGQWTQPSTFYAHWLDALVAGEQTYMIVDSKTVAPFTQSYRRPHVTTVHVVHGSHLDRDDPSRLEKIRRPVLENLHEWDAVTFLTERQRDEVVDLVGDSGNLVVVPNSIQTPPGAASDDRDPHHGVIVASLTPRKRIDHALEIIAAARAAGAPVAAEIVGDGEERAALEARAKELGLEDTVRFAGYQTAAATWFEDASWMLLTSVSEGAPLTLLEAMARGCIPIAYDIRYGPADTIAQGENGFVVADGDIAAAASVLLRLCSESVDTPALRSRARDTARRYSDADIVARWAIVLADARRRHEYRDAARLQLARVRIRRIRGRLRMSATVSGSPRRAQMWMQLLAGKGRAPVRVPLRRVGRYATGRLSREQTAPLGRRRLQTRIIVGMREVQVALDAGEQRVDPRSLRRRAAERIRRLLRRAT